MGKNQIKIIEFKPEFAKDFAALNYEWLHKYFEVEPHDTEILENPKEFILDSGGQIVMALFNQKVVGTVALIKMNPHMVELSKMAVTKAYQGLKIGNKLMEAAIELARKMKFATIMLESNRKLVPAISLYKKFGFVEVPTNPNSEYKRADIKMELHL